MDRHNRPPSRSGTTGARGTTPAGQRCVTPPDATGPPTRRGPEPVTDGGLGWHDLNAFQRDVLLAIANLGVAHPSGREIGEQLAADVGRDVGGSRLYQALDSLAGRGLIQKRRGTVDARTNEYHLTEAGALLIAEHTRYCKRVLARSGDGGAPIDCCPP